MQLFTSDGPTLQNQPTQSLKNWYCELADKWSQFIPMVSDSSDFIMGIMWTKTAVSEIPSYWDFTND